MYDSQGYLVMRDCVSIFWKLNLLILGILSVDSFDEEIC